MKERPILFSTDMVRAILDGRKTQTRRIPSKQNSKWEVGDRLWVKETWRIGAWNENEGQIAVDYKAGNYARREWLQVPDEKTFERYWIQSTDDAIAAGIQTDNEGVYHWEPGKSPCRWRPSIFMPRWASRIEREITRMRAERVQDISIDDIYAEGCPIADPQGAYGWYIDLWDSINAKRGYSWESNPKVKVIEFKVISANKGG